MDIIFDVDGTLCDPKQPMDPDFAEWFRRFIHVNQIQENRVFLVTGGNWDETNHQLGSDICHAVDFCCNELGNVIRYRGKLTNSPVMKFSDQLFDFIDQLIDQSVYSIKHTHSIKVNQCTVSFSVAGVFCSQEQRQRYSIFDKASGERDHMCANINRKFPNLTAQKGGDTSVDITFKGHDKSWIARFVNDPCVFIADQIVKGGNDHSLAMKLKTRNINHNDYFKVNNWCDTWEILHTFDPKPTTVFSPYR